MKKSELIFTILQVPIDFLMIIFSFIIVYFLRGRVELPSWRILEVLEVSPEGMLLPIEQYILIVIIIALAWILIFALRGLYSLRTQKKGLDLIYSIFSSISLGTMAIFAISFLLKEEPLKSRFAVIAGWFMGIILVSIGRFFIGRIQKWLYKYGIGVHTAIIIGKDQTAPAIYQELQNNLNWGIKIIDNFSEKDFYHSQEKIKSLIKNVNINELIQAKPLSEEDTLSLLNFCKDLKIKFKFVPNLFETNATNIDSSTCVGIPIIELKKTPLEGWGRIYKRFVDLLGSFLALILLSPLFLILAILINIDSPGPVFFKHKRIGRGGKTFYLYKFRTMIKNAEEILKEKLKSDSEFKKQFEKEYKLKDDLRVTKLGKILRKTSLDELPQFINVLKGEISLVGPRPIVKDELEKYGRHKEHLLVLKPGITGLWQVSGRTDLSYEERINLDIHYVQNWSLWLDFKIMLKTIPAILKKQGAY